MWAGSAVLEFFLPRRPDVGHGRGAVGAVGCPLMGSLGRRGGQNEGAPTARDFL